ncbi:MAG: hypothetical protein OWQ50_08650 [Acidianus infernus]|nr:hypothetical protein [Acidianus infernus]
MLEAPQEIVNKAKHLDKLYRDGGLRGWIAQDINDAPPQLKYEQPAIRD